MAARAIDLHHSDTTAPASVAYVLRSYPRLSQTFVLNEIRFLERTGVRIRIFAITDPKEAVVQPEVSAVRAPVEYLDSPFVGTWRAVFEHVRMLGRFPLRYFRTMREVVGRKEIDAGYRVASRFRCFLYALRLASSLERLQRREAIRVDHMHAHFAHDPTLVVLLTHHLTGIPFSFSAHARDLYQVSPRVLIPRVDRARAVVTCCAANIEYLRSVVPAGSRTKLLLVHHGVDLDEFDVPGDDGEGDRRAVPALVSAGRLVEKKGFDDLLAMCHELALSGRAFRCRIFGDGPERARLAKMIERFRLQDHVSLMGAVPRRDILTAYREADVFVLLPHITDTGDRDGIPNVVIEAMGSGLPVVTTEVGGILELVTNGVDGLIGRPRDVKGITALVMKLLDDRPKRVALRVAARRTIEQRFDARQGVERLATLFGQRPTGSHIDR